MSLTCGRALVEYVRGMEAVNVMDAYNARANIKMNRCPRRYHRQNFHGLLSTVGYHNVRVAVEALLPPDMLADLKQEKSNVGYSTWFQDE